MDVTRKLIFALENIRDLEARYIRLNNVVEGIQTQLHAMRRNQANRMHSIDDEAPILSYIQDIKRDIQRYRFENISFCAMEIEEKVKDQSFDPAAVALILDAYLLLSNNTGDPEQAINFIADVSENLEQIRDIVIHEDYQETV